MVLLLTLTLTSYLVYNLALSLLRRFVIIYLDNYFTFVPLFAKLQACNFGAISIIRLYKEFLYNLLELKNRFTIKFKWNTLFAVVV